MHKYERYIIYPLLILALFYGMSGSSIIETSAENIMNRIVGKEVVIVNDKGQEVLNISSNDVGGASISMKDQDGNKGITLETDEEGYNSLVLHKPNQDVGIFMSTSNSSAQMQIYGPNDKTIDNNGNFKEGTMVLGVYENQALLDIGDMGSNPQKNAGISMFSRSEANINGLVLTGNNGEGATILRSDGDNSRVNILNMNNESIVDIGPAENNDAGIWLYDNEGENEKFYGSQ